jgi:hypothetical protein
VNAPDLGSFAKKPHLFPYISLGEKIGAIHAQLLKNNKIGSISISLRGKDIAVPQVAGKISLSLSDLNNCVNRCHQVCCIEGRFG